METFVLKIEFRAPELSAAVLHDLILKQEQKLRRLVNEQLNDEEELPLKYVDFDVE